MSVRNIAFRNMLGVLLGLDEMCSYENGLYYGKKKLEDNSVLKLEVNGAEVGKYSIGKIRRGLDEFKKKVHEFNGVLEKDQGFAAAIGTIIITGRDYKGEVKEIADRCFI